MASTVSKKRIRRARPRNPTPRTAPLDEERMKELMKQAVREVLQEREQQGAPAPSQQSQGERAPRARVNPLEGKSREEVIALARQAEGSWTESEGTGTAVEIVRRLRDEWKHRPQ